MDPRVRALLEPKKANKPQRKTKTSVNIDSLSRLYAEQPSEAPATTVPPVDSVSVSVSVSPSPQTSPRSVRTFDPRALLNPRNKNVSPTSQRKSPAIPKTMTDIVHDPSRPYDIADGSQFKGMSFLESLHGVEQRIDRPAKRVKSSPDNSQDVNERKPSSKFTHRSNGAVGDFFKPKPQIAMPSANLAGLVDLTNDDEDLAEDSDVQVTAVRSKKFDEEVCFGAIEATIQAHKVPKPRVGAVDFTANKQWPLIKCTLARIPEQNILIECIDPFGTTFGHLASDVASALAPALDGIKKLRTQARVMPRPKRENEWPHTPCSSNIRVVVNVYGRRGDTQKIGKLFGQHNIWFRLPMGVDSGVEVDNPHAPKVGNPNQARATTGSHTHASSRTVEEATEAVSRLFDHLATSSGPQIETEGPPSIITPLLSHQKQALTFMLHHELPRTFGPEEQDNSSLWRRRYKNNGAPLFEEVVTGTLVTEEPAQVFGGLLADVMGLGKTIEALSLIASTLEEAVVFGQQELKRSTSSEASLVTNSRATLIVAPVSTVKNWEDQINDHVNPGDLTYYVYHGGSRERDPFELAKYDIVISTYSTISAEMSNKYSLQESPIKSTHWFRIILDEAHTIREPKSAQSQAMCSLFAQRRWCLTGTPIQNRMDDLGSLTRFLRLYPYDTTAGFNQYVRAPAQSHDPSFLKSLRVFVDSFTLRRLKDRIDLPPRKDERIKLEFSEEEKKLHDFFQDKFSLQVKEFAASQRKKSGIDYHHVLRGIMVLRLICAHGRDLLKRKDLEEAKGMSQNDAIELDDDDMPLQTITERDAYQSLSLMTEAGLDLCKVCDKKLSGDSPKSELDDGVDRVRAYVLPCYDMICADCFSAGKAVFDQHKQADLAIKCPCCSASMKPEYVPISRSVTEVLETAPDDTLAELDDKGRCAYTGPHTKTKALLEDIAEMKRDSQVFEERGESPLKCVVFSEFTSHLDLIGRALSDKGYEFVRIDGSMPLPKRRIVLDKLNGDDHVTILLASIKAAGQGLNLTVASRAFIMEPMWNPAAEAQAVDRIYRIGQKRDVLVKRYHMSPSFEDKIVNLQQKKQQMADFSLDKSQIHMALSKKESREQNMKAILDLFK